MRLLISLLCPICLSLMISPLLAQVPAKSVVWFHSDFPPISIISGPFKDRGAADQWGALLMQQMPDYQHELIPANAARLQEEMKQRGNGCSRALLKNPEREKNFIFSEPLVSFLPNGLITLRSRKADLEPFLNERGELRLDALLNARKFEIAVAAGRSFGPSIDPVLQAGSAQGKLVQFNASDLFSSGLLRLSNHQGVDAVMGYAIELSWAIRRFDLKPSQFWFIPVEGETALLPVHIACSRSPTGEAIIGQINALVHEGKLPDAAARAYRDWLPADIAQYYDRRRKPAASGKRSK
ncbi:hypothetical protein GCM10027046_14660 [Uliginosibacterium flavum]|uniref:TIGR02285 family protein n=1 Tax=Uliginosibacterium flavum TaxID=1396831 RepID=A0ABV2TQT2_9RHOO